MSHCETSELRNTITALTSEIERANQAAAALLRKFQALDGLAFTEFEKSLAVTTGWMALTDTIATISLHLHEQALQLQRIGIRILEPFDTARQQQEEANTDASERAGRVTEYARAETDAKPEADALRHRLRSGEKLSADERGRAEKLGVLLPPHDSVATTHW
jgi:hypothetical protein